MAWHGWIHWKGSKTTVTALHCNCTALHCTLLLLLLLLLCGRDVESWFG